jgi:hypothetical protein
LDTATPQHHAREDRGLAISMPRAAILWAICVALGMSGCGEETGEGSSSTRAAIPSAAATSRDEFYSTMDDLVTRLDRAVAASLAGEADAVGRIRRVLRDTRKQLKARRAAGEGVSPAGNFVLTTAMSAREYAMHGEREGLQLIRDVPLIEARDGLKSEAGRR